MPASQAAWMAPIASASGTWWNNEPYDAPPSPLGDRDAAPAEDPCLCRVHAAPCVPDYSSAIQGKCASLGGPQLAMGAWRDP